MSKTYSISDLAKEFDITTRTIRFYESEGLISPERQGQTRIYSEKDRVMLKLILRGKRLGFSLAESRAILDLYDPQTGNKDQLQLLLSKIYERREALQRQLKDIEVMQRDLNEAEARCLEAMSGLTD
ncbi:MerR family transcriptional regulator [Hahella sp. CCB-MM4]|uniref:MerR family transcriptional regulator n=1 Tax=Hahella sp. (strain CCB-MM4) TaxID=1926491 RepID=UPI000B9AB25C|nr:MerR family DNA-binding transcriptional regulator [Hahella sp. CCB-MM4]OZG73380.1 MerR family transcriptional regulator [Hahella sp. CCB-MM4]